MVVTDETESEEGEGEKVEEGEKGEEEGEREEKEGERDEGDWAGGGGGPLTRISSVDPELRDFPAFKFLTRPDLYQFAKVSTHFC